MINMMKGKDTKNGIEFEAREYRQQAILIAQEKEKVVFKKNFLIATIFMLLGLNIAFAFIGNSVALINTTLIMMMLLGGAIAIQTKEKQSVRKK